ncbi:uncharacterized protein K452DRAFT_120656 [Aplosporella prunicola CBS 121167]|uniref:Uncharacterized protein n=1 Tax=Aplosporella prunicola CBS 121167 TaxID=1176127 RepID=A0A6A6BQA6_9PEZI|nr:uncharacterized protein K452DRAFT_120656 [Aplosporella prunicola CBS 121167]KAF2145485.1 hypothetical protein K452DRAFT_120656 [Aplosporella prunicola CBS 121167]
MPWFASHHPPWWPSDRMRVMARQDHRARQAFRADLRPPGRPTSPTSHPQSAIRSPLDEAEAVSRADSPPCRHACRRASGSAPVRVRAKPVVMPGQARAPRLRVAVPRGPRAAAPASAPASSSRLDSRQGAPGRGDRGAVVWGGGRASVARRLLLITHAGAGPAAAACWVAVVRTCRRRRALRCVWTTGGRRRTADGGSVVPLAPDDSGSKGRGRGD